MNKSTRDDSYDDLYDDSYDGLYYNKKPKIKPRNKNPQIKFKRKKLKTINYQNILSNKYSEYSEYLEYM